MALRLSAAVIAALLAGTFAASSIPAQAQDRSSPRMEQRGGPGMHDRDMDRRGGGLMLEGERGGRGRMARGLVNLVCTERGAEQLEIALVRLSHRIEFSDAQRTAFDDLRATALAAQTTFSDACIAAREAAPTAGDRDLVSRLQTRLAVQSAEVDALRTVLPKLEAFYGTLTEEQKTSLQPPMRRDDRNVGERRRQGGPGMQRALPPEEAVTAPAPSAEPVPDAAPEVAPTP